MVTLGLEAVGRTPAVSALLSTPEQGHVTSTDHGGCQLGTCGEGGLPGPSTLSHYSFLFHALFFRRESLRDGK